MRLRLALVAGICFSLGGLSASKAAILTQWDFEASYSNVTDSTTSGNIAASTGTGTATGIHADALSDWSAPAGNGSAQSLSGTRWALGDYFQFESSSTGFENISLSWAQRSSGSGPADFTLYYGLSTGGPFNSVGDYSVLTTTFASGTFKSSLVFDTTVILSLDLSGITALEDASTIVFRLVQSTANRADGGTTGIGAAGTSSIDDFTINGDRIVTNVIPEPASLIVWGLLGLIGTSRMRSRRLA